MFRNVLVIGSSLGFAVSLAGADIASSLPTLSATQIVDKNVAARGGLEAWRAVKTMSLAGKLGAGGNQRATLQVPNPGPTVVSAKKSGQQVAPLRPVEEVRLLFLMELERPRKMRFELEFNGQTAVQVFDGANGWKLRPFLGRRVVEPYTADEMKTASIQADLDGPLVDYAAKGTRVELAGTEKVEGRDAYKIKMTMQSSQVLHVWIDALTFLETKIEGQPRRLDGTDHPVEVYFRDYRQVDGLQIPFVLETKVLTVAKTALGLRDVPVPPERVSIDKVMVNPKFDETLFSKPEAGLSARVVQ
jgi:hypothetical protein